MTLSTVAVASPASLTTYARASSALTSYALKWRGVGGAPLPRPALPFMACSFIGTFAGIGTLALLQYLLPPVVSSGTMILAPSMAATAVLVYAAPSAPLAQPRCVIGGHVISALIGVAIRKLLVELPPPWTDAVWLAATLSTALSISAMEALSILHPPGGATALIAATNPAAVALGWSFVYAPALVSSVILTLVALLVNNASSKRQHPQFW